MSAQPLPTQNEADSQYYRATLHELIDMGTAIARTVHAQALARPGAEPDADGARAPDLAARFERIARCVRRTILLARHVAEPLKPAVGPDRTAARKRILRECEDSIARAAFNARNRPGCLARVDALALHVELLERLERLDLAEDLDGDIAIRPIPDIIQDICRDLGLGLHDMPGCSPAPRRTPADIATLLARARQAPRPGDACAVQVRDG